MRRRATWFLLLTPIVLLAKISRLLPVLLLLVLCRPFVEAQTPAPPPVKRALLIGISDYSRGEDPAAEWWDLASSADVTALKTALVSKFGFRDADVVALTTRSQTTRASILDNLNTLLARTRRGDIVYVHYSGHGTPVPDRNGDEADRFDETIVPSDYVSRRDGGRNITDDEIGAWLAKLAARMPASVNLSFDSCFSGTQTRGGLQRVRGGRYLGDTASAPSDRGLGGLDVPAAFAKGYVVLSAARHDQVANETFDEHDAPMGLLTYALVRALHTAGPSTTYRDLFDGVLETMGQRNAEQVPQLEGDIDTPLMSGIAAPPMPYTETRAESGRLLLQAGSLHGVTSGSLFALYPRGARVFDAQRSLTQARVTTVRATTADLVPDQDIPRDTLNFARAIEVAHVLPSARIRVDIADLDRLARGAELRSQLQTMPGHERLFRLTRAGVWDVKVCAGGCPEAVRGAPSNAETRANAEPQAITLIRQDGTRIASLLDGPEVAQRVRQALEREVRWRTIAQIDHRDPRVDIQVRIVPATVTRNAAGAVTGAVRTSAMPRTAGKQPVLKIGDYFMIELRHVGTQDAFVTVLDLSPDGVITPLWPHPSLGSRVQENRVRAAIDPQAAEWILIPYPYVFQVGPPTGREIVKAIVTDTATSFSPLLQPASAGSRSLDSPPESALGDLLASVAGVQSRQVPVKQPPDTTVWSSSAFTFLIEPDERTSPR